MINFGLLLHAGRISVFGQAVAALIIDTALWDILPFVC